MKTNMKNKHIITHTISCIITIFTLVTFASSAEKCNPEDKKVLFKIKKHFGEPYFASWQPDTDCCKSWYQVRCDPFTHRVNTLEVFNGDLPGTIPEAVGDLTYLETLFFHKLPNITGPVQPAIAKLVHLRLLRLDRLNLTGSVPDFLSNLKKLYYLDLSFNKLTGSIPGSLSTLPNLLALHLDRNKLTGSIPESFGSFQGSTPDLYLSHNNLSGKIPTSLRKLNFSVIDFSRNKLEGDASFLFGPNKSANRIDLSRNLLEFNLSKVFFQSDLEDLDINHNRIYGGIPKEITQLSLQFINVSYNRLCGSIPQGGRLQNFDYSSYFHNRSLCGDPLPACK